jgi:hypothetical protein
MTKKRQSGQTWINDEETPVRADARGAKQRKVQILKSELDSAAM